MIAAVQLFLPQHSPMLPLTLRSTSSVSFVLPLTLIKCRSRRSLLSNVLSKKHKASDVCVCGQMKKSMFAVLHS